MAEFISPALADGKVIAYRLAEDFESDSRGKKDLSYSSCFTLVEHHYQTPLKQKICFYSLYMHLLPSKHYEDREFPSFLGEERTLNQEVVLETPFPVQGGDVLGYPGKYEQENLFHLEIFFEDIEFFKNEKKDQTPRTYHFPKGTVFQDREYPGHRFS